MPVLPDVIELRVIGTPKAQGSKKGFVVNGRAVIADVRSAALNAWRTAVGQSARDWLAQSDGGRTQIDGPVAVRMAFRIVPPAKLRRPYPSVPPDIDKLARAVLDGLTGVLLKDDARVVDLHATKRYAVDDLPGVTVTIETLKAEAPDG